MFTLVPELILKRRVPILYTRRSKPETTKKPLWLQRRRSNRWKESKTNRGEDRAKGLVPASNFSAFQGSTAMKPPRSPTKKQLQSGHFSTHEPKTPPIRWGLKNANPRSRGEFAVRQSFLVAPIGAHTIARIANHFWQQKHLNFVHPERYYHEGLPLDAFVAKAVTTLTSRP